MGMGGGAAASKPADPAHTALLPASPHGVWARARSSKRGRLSAPSANGLRPHGADHHERVGWIQPEPETPPCQPPPPKPPSPAQQPTPEEPAPSRQPQTRTATQSSRPKPQINAADPRDASPVCGKTHKRHHSSAVRRDACTHTAMASLSPAANGLRPQGASDGCSPKPEQQRRAAAPNPRSMPPTPETRVLSVAKRTNATTALPFDVTPPAHTPRWRLSAPQQTACALKARLTPTPETRVLWQNAQTPPQLCCST